MKRRGFFGRLFAGLVAMRMPAEELSSVTSQVTNFDDVAWGPPEPGTVVGVDLATSQCGFSQIIFTGPFKAGDVLVIEQLHRRTGEWMVSLEHEVKHDVRCVNIPMISLTADDFRASIRKPNKPDSDLGAFVVG